MAIASGQRITAALLRRLQPKTYFAVGSGTVAAGSTNADVTDATVTVVTETAAVYTVDAIWDVDLAAATTALWIGRLNVDGALVSPLGTFGGEVATDRATVPQTYRGTLSGAGSHTLKLVTTTAAGQTVAGQNSSLLVTIYEVV